MNFLLKPTGLNIVILLAIILFVGILGPYLVLWALNTLFPVLALKYSFDSWCAVVLLHAFFTTAIRTNSKDSS